MSATILVLTAACARPVIPPQQVRLAAEGARCPDCASEVVLRFDWQHRFWSIEIIHSDSCPDFDRRRQIGSRALSQVMVVRHRAAS